MESHLPKVSNPSSQKPHKSSHPGTNQPQSQSAPLPMLAPTSTPPKLTKQMVPFDNIVTSRITSSNRTAFTVGRSNPAQNSSSKKKYPSEQHQQQQFTVREMVLETQLQADKKMRRALQPYLSGLPANTPTINSTLVSPLLMRLKEVTSAKINQQGLTYSTVEGILDVSEQLINSKQRLIGSQLVFKSHQDILNHDFENSLEPQEDLDKYEVVFLNKSTAQHLNNDAADAKKDNLRERQSSKQSYWRGFLDHSVQDIYSREKSEAKQKSSLVEASLQTETKSLKKLRLVKKRIEAKSQEPKKCEQRLPFMLPKAIKFHFKKGEDPEQVNHKDMPAFETPGKIKLAPINRSRTLMDNTNADPYMLCDDLLVENPKKQFRRSQAASKSQNPTKSSSKKSKIRRTRSKAKSKNSSTLSPSPSKQRVLKQPLRLVLQSNPKNPLQHKPTKHSDSEQPIKTTEEPPPATERTNRQNATSGIGQPKYRCAQSKKSIDRVVDIKPNTSEEFPLCDNSFNSHSQGKASIFETEKRSWVESSPNAVSKQPTRGLLRSRVSVRSTDRGPKDSESQSTNLLTSKPTRELASEYNIFEVKKQPVQQAGTRGHRNQIQIAGLNTPQQSSAEVTARSIELNESVNHGSRAQATPLLNSLGLHLQKLKDNTQPKQLGMGKRSLLISNTSLSRDYQHQNDQSLVTIAYTTREERKSTSTDQDNSMPIRLLGTNLINNLQKLENQLHDFDKEDAADYVEDLFDQIELAEDYANEVFEGVLVAEAEEQSQEFRLPKAINTILPPPKHLIDLATGLESKTHQSPLQDQPNSIVKPEQLSIFKQSEPLRIKQATPPATNQAGPPEILKLTQTNRTINHPEMPSIVISSKPKPKQDGTVNLTDKVSSPETEKILRTSQDSIAQQSEIKLLEECAEEYIIQLTSACLELDEASSQQDHQLAEVGQRSRTATFSKPSAGGERTKHGPLTASGMASTEPNIKEGLHSLLKNVKPTAPQITAGLSSTNPATQGVAVANQIIQDSPENDLIVVKSQNIKDLTDDEFLEDADEYVSYVDDWVSTQMAIRETLAEARGVAGVIANSMMSTGVLKQTSNTYPSRVIIPPCRIKEEKFYKELKTLNKKFQSQSEPLIAKRQFNRQRTKSRFEMLKEANYSIRLALPPSEPRPLINKKQICIVPIRKHLTVIQPSICQLGEFYAGTGLTFFSSYISKSKKSKIYSARSGRRVHTNQEVIRDMPSTPEINPWTLMSKLNSLESPTMSLIAKGISAFPSSTRKIHLVVPDELASRSSLAKNPRSLLRSKNQANSGSNMGSMSSSNLNFSPPDAKNLRGIAADSGQVSEKSYAQAYEREILFLKQQGDRRAEEIYRERNNLFKSHMNSMASSKVEEYFRHTPNPSYEKSEFEMDFKPPRKIKGFDPSKYEFSTEDKPDANCDNNLRRKAANVGMSAIANIKGFEGAKIKFENANDPFNQYKMVRLGNGPYDFLIQDFEDEDDFHYLVMGDEKAVKSWSDDTLKIMQKQAKSQSKVSTPSKTFKIEPLLIGHEVKPATNHQVQLRRVSSVGSQELNNSDKHSRESSGKGFKVPIPRRSRTKPLDDSDKEKSKSDSDDDDENNASSQDSILQKKSKLIINAKTNGSRKPSKESKESDSEKDSDADSEKSGEEESSDDDEDDEDSGNSSSSEREAESADSPDGENPQSKVTEKEKMQFVVKSIQMHWDTVGITGVQASYSHQDQTVAGKLHGRMSEESGTLDVAPGDRCYQIWSEIGDSLLKCLKFVMGRGDTVRLGLDDYDSRTRVYNYSIKRRKLSRIFAGFGSDGYLVCLAFKLVKGKL